MNTSHEKDGFSVRAYQGDARTLLSFNLPKSKTANLAGFTIQVRPGTKKPYYLYNTLRFEKPKTHAQVAKEPANSSVNSPIHKFRWVHVPGSFHQGTKPFFGPYTYTVTPRHFDGNQSMLPLDASLSVSVKLEVKPFERGKVELGFTRGFTQSQAFVRHFGKKAKFRPKGDELLFDTAQVSGKNDQGVEYTYEEEYEWLGFTARARILELLRAVRKGKKLRLDVFAYDLNEPDVMKLLLGLAGQGRVRVILDNAALHHKADNSEREDRFESLFSAAAKGSAAILRGKFGRFAHDKVFIVSDATGPLKVLTGSTNYSITGLYVNSNHVIIFNDRGVAEAYAKVFQIAWDAKMWDGKQSSAFSGEPEAAKTFSFAATGVPPTDIAFSPHKEAFALKLLQGITKRIEKEESSPKGSVLFAVMGLDKKSTGPVFPVLREVHANQQIFTYGISDTPDGISLYTRRKKIGVLVSGKPVKTKLPPPFNQVPGVGLGHQVHHKFIVCGFNGTDPVVYCGSSNLALGGEKANGDNLLEIRDEDIATVFAIEAVGLVDHFEFLDRHAIEAGKKEKTAAEPNSPSKSALADAAGWFLSTDDDWVAPYYDEDDLRCADRKLFA
jgi:hypothetical protein